MVFDGSKIDSVVEFKVPNGGYAVLDSEGRILAYNKRGVPHGNDWDYVRSDCRK